MEGGNQVQYRDAFLGTVQRNGRALQAIRFPLVVSFCRPSGNVPPAALKTILEAAYCDHGTINIIAESEQKLMLMFSNDDDARTAYQQLHNATIADNNGPVLQFKIWNPIDELGYDVADHHIYFSIRGLPQHLWKRDVVDQIMHPFCALGHLSEETMSRRDLSSYTAFAWSQKRISVPRRMSLKVTKEISGDASLQETNDYKEVSTYRLEIDAVGFLCDITTECSCNLEGLNIRYEEAYDGNNAQCFLTEVPDNKDLLTELDYAIIATTNEKNHGCQKEEFQDMVSEYLGCVMRVHRISETQFMIMTPDQSARNIAKEILLQKMTFRVSMTDFALDVWKPQNMSVVERMHEKVSLTVNQIPAHLCTSKIVRFILSPYCAMDGNNQPAETLITSEKFTCTAWTDSAVKISERIMAALLVREPDAEQMEEGYGSADLRITQLIVDKTTLGGHQMN